MLRSVNLTTSSVRSLVAASSAPRQALIGPAVRLLLQDYNIDPKKLKASGPKGNLLKSDVISHISKSNLKPQAKSETVKIEKIVGSQKKQGRKKYEDIPLKDGDLKRNLTEAHYSLTSELIVDDLLSELRKLELKTGEINSEHSLFNDFIQKASAEACKRVPQANISIEPLVSVSRTILESEKNEGHLHSNEFRISNLGSHGSVDHFMPIGQPHSQTYTIAIGSARKRLMPFPDGIKQVTTIKVTLSCDHRAVDTTLGAEWFKHFKRFVENPNTILL